mmetsp:Transcript_8708/g.18487  ORF Transcript_8708/g.18487 Transcript_8708/m.18487 type:complete len:154 (+) Transcript_8708:622-1083(+)
MHSPEENLKKLPPYTHLARVVDNACDTPSTNEYDDLPALSSSSTTASEVTSIASPALPPSEFLSSPGTTRPTRNAEKTPTHPIANNVWDHPTSLSSKIDKDAIAPPSATPVPYRLVARDSLSFGTFSVIRVYAVGVEKAQKSPITILQNNTSL